MSLRFSLALARRELRSSSRRIGVYMLSISLGVMALVAIHGFSADLDRAVQDEAERLLGANARLSSNRPFPDPVLAVVDSLATAGHPSARVTSVASMVMAPRTATVRLLQVRGVDPAYPFFGTVRTVPAGAWPPRAGEALVDPAVLTMLDARLGDSLVVGDVTFRVSATIEDLMGDFGLQTAVGPRVWIERDRLDAAGLIAFGSLVRYERYLSLPDPGDRETVQTLHRPLFDSAQVRWTTAEAQARRLTRSLNYLSRYLGLVGLAALLLGGVGVGSAVHVFVRERRTAVAVLRCVGAGQASIFSAYLIQAGVLGLGGAALGALAGIGVQRLLPLALAGVLPVQVAHRLAWPPVLAGLGMGLWVALLFAWLPLLALRDVPPLAALRDDIEPSRRRADPLRLLAWVALAGTVVLLSALEAPERDQGLGFAAGLGATVAVLWGVSSVVVRLTRKYFPKRAPYPVRQGIANLFRPQNQTVAITIALGFGVFAVGTILQVESALVSGLALDESGRANLVLFDIQPDQEAGVIAALPTVAREAAVLVPLVPARIAAVNGATVAELSAGGRVRGRLRREYRNTWRDTLTTSETLVEGSWWEDGDMAPGGVAADDIARISLEAELAESLRVGIGDQITWDFAGREVETVITSLRTVDWGPLRAQFLRRLRAGGDRGCSPHIGHRGGAGRSDRAGPAPNDAGAYLPEHLGSGHDPRPGSARAGARTSQRSPPLPGALHRRGRGDCARWSPRHIALPAHAGERPTQDVGCAAGADPYSAAGRIPCARDSSVAHWNHARSGRVRCSNSHRVRAGLRARPRVSRPAVGRGHRAHGAGGAFGERRTVAAPASSRA